MALSEAVSLRRRVRYTRLRKMRPPVKMVLSNQHRAQEATDYAGTYPGSPGHGSAIPPEESALLVSRIQVRSDRAFDVMLNDSWRMLRWHRSLARNVFRLIRYHDEIGTNGGNKFVYTCRYGWIDHGHFFHNALGTYVSSPKILELASWLNEFGQDLAGSDSAWTPEDLISNGGRKRGQEP